MRISQADFRTILIDRESISCRLRYNLYQEGEIRYPESISCRGDTIVAYFLTSTIRDFIAENEYGFFIERYWNIVPEGNFGLSFCLEFPAEPEMAYLFPGLKAGHPLPQCSYLAPGARSCYANGLFVFRNREGMLIFSDPAPSMEETGSIELQCLHDDDDRAFIRAELRIPAVYEGPLKRRARKGNAALLRSDGQFEYSLRLNLATAARDRILRQGIAAVLERNSAGLQPFPRLPAARLKDFVEEQIASCLQTFLTDRGPLCGLLETKGSKKLSSLAGCTLALIQMQYRSEDRDAVELSLRLADFSLKGQHPRGLFYPFFWNDRQSWLPATAPVSIPLNESAAIALMLLRFAGLLQTRGLPASAYLHAASHMADSLLHAAQDLDDLSNLLRPDSLFSAGDSAGAPGLIELFLELHKVTGRDVYRKAARRLGSRYLSQQQKTTALQGLGDDAPDLDTGLLLAQAAVSLQDSGYAVKGIQQYFDVLLPWIYLNRPDPGSAFNPMGALRHSWGDPTLRFRGFEFSHTLLKLSAGMKKSSRLTRLDLLVSQLLAFSLQKPLGTPFFDPEQKASDRFGLLSSRVWMRELYSLTRLAEEFPDFLPLAGSP